MKRDLAFSLISQHLGWTDAELAEEFSELQMMIDHKYDRYHGFQPATRFHVSLLDWLSQFPDQEKKKTCYRILKERLVFISQVEMHHLVSLFMPVFDRHARRKVASELGIPFHRTWDDEAAIRRLGIMRRRTLFVGLSDGARMDVFRRYNEDAVSNEQVVAISEIGEDKWEDLGTKLAERLEGKDAEAKFETICLVDDFAGSGSSLLRKKDNGAGWSGKISRFYRANKDRIGKLLQTGCTLHIHHHLASSQAKHQIEKSIGEFSQESQDFNYEVTYGHVLPPEVVINDGDSDTELTDLLKHWYDSGIEDEHTGADIWYGYKQCGLPLVLEHNTPNNSVALLWAASKPGAAPHMRPLFARRKRHSSNG